MSLISEIDNIKNEAILRNLAWSYPHLEVSLKLF